MNTEVHNHIVNRKMRPAWLERLLSETNFFRGCEIHRSEKKNEINVFCVDCHLAICQHCIPRHHHFNEGNLLQIRRYVYHDVIRLQDIEKLIDCSFVQPYIINSAKVVFLNPRPQSRPSKPGAAVGINGCRACDRNLQEKFRFCCLACKVDSYTKGGEENLQKILMPVINANHPLNGCFYHESSLNQAPISASAVNPFPDNPPFDDFNRSPTSDQLSPHSVIFFPHDSLSPSNSYSNSSMSNSNSSSKSLLNNPAKSIKSRNYLVSSGDALFKSRRHNLGKCRNNIINSADRLIKSHRFHIKSRDAVLKPRANLMNSRADHLKFHASSGELGCETPKFIPTLSANCPSLIRSAVSLPIVTKRRILSPSSSSSSSSFSQMIGSSDHSDYNIISDHSFRKRSRKGEPMRSHLS